MKNNIEKNLLKTIIFIFISISSSMILAISFFYVKNTQDNFEKQLLKYKSNYYIEIENSLNPDYAIGKFQSKQTYYKI